MFSIVEINDCVEYCYSWNGKCVGKDGYINFFIMVMWYLDFYTIRKIPYKLHASLFVHDILAYIIPRQGCKISRTFRFTRSRCLFVETWEDPKPQHKMWLSHALFHPLVLFFIVLALPFIIKSSPQSLPPLPFFSSTHANTRVFLFILPFLLPLLNRLSTI